MRVPGEIFRQCDWAGGAEPIKVDGRSGSCEPCPLAEKIYIRTLFEWSVPVGTTRVE